MSCLFPTCSRHPESNGYCIFHKIYSNSAEVKMPKEPKKVSDTRKEANKELKKLYIAYLSKPENKYCKVQLNGCTNVANVVHHVRGRIGEQVFNQADWLACCPSCNIVLESQDSLAREKGVKKSKFNKA